MTAVGWQDLIVVLATLLAGAWLLRRWIHKRRTRVGCDTCAAAAHSRMARRPAKANPPSPGGP